MRLGIMQPYFFPYLGYFSLIDAVDRWIVFDSPQYIRRGWVNHNRVLKRGKGDWKYVSIPVVKADRDTPINQMLIDDSSDWRDELIRNLDHYRDQRVPHYRNTVDFLGRTLAFTTDNLSEALTHLLRETCAYIGIRRPIEVLSEMGLGIGSVNHPGEWALRICESLSATAYINPPGGREIFDPKQFADAGIELQFLTAALPPYDQRRTEFMPGLSIIDALMWNSPSDVHCMITQYNISS